MKKALTLLIFCLTVYKQTGAQDNRCGTNIYLKQLLKDQPLLSEQLQKAEADRTLRLQAPASVSNSVISIPVVFHVVYDKAEQNVSDARILEQLDVLNNDYQRLNQDAAATPEVFKTVAGTFNIQFCLAKRDPNGKPTTGIERKKTTVTSFTNFDDVKKVSAGGLKGWSKSKYLNVWICNLSGSVLGYANIPGTANDTLDGVVVAYTTIGGPDDIAVHPTYNLGRTLTHEVGHWFNLVHVWGDDGGTCTGSDFVGDTPNQASEHYGTPAFPYISCNNGPNGDMFMNYLDYSDDIIMNVFTNGQVARMNDALTVDRAAILNSKGCVDTISSIDIGIAEVLNASGVYCSGIQTPSIVLKNYGLTNLSSATINYSIDDNTAQNTVWTGLLLAGKSDTITLLPLTFSSGIHTFTVNITVANDVNLSNNIRVTQLTIADNGTMLPFKEDFENKRFPTDSWKIMNAANDGTWMRSRLASTKGNASMWIDTPVAPTITTIDDINLEPLNLSTLADPLLSFDIAYAHDDLLPGSHTLKIYASVDCGETFTEIYAKTGKNLATTTTSQKPFIPTEQQWRKDTVGLAAFASNTSVILKFRSVSGNANGLFIDNINIAKLADIFPNAGNINISLLPVTDKGFLHFAIHLLKTEDCIVQLYDVLGRKIFEQPYSGTFIEDNINLRAINTGIYLLRAVSGNDKKTLKIFYSN
jgi:hypothetical protein